MKFRPKKNERRILLAAVILTFIVVAANQHFHQNKLRRVETFKKITVAKIKMNGHRRVEYYFCIKGIRYAGSIMKRSIRNDSRLPQKYFWVAFDSTDPRNNQLMTDRPADPVEYGMSFMAICGSD